MKRTLFLLAVLFSLSLTSCKQVDAKTSTDAAVDTTKVDNTALDTTAVKTDTIKK
jgi:hypothetical protein